MNKKAMHFYQFVKSNSIASTVNNEEQCSTSQEERGPLPDKHLLSSATRPTTFLGTMGSPRADTQLQTSRF